jgi:ribosome-associated protein
LNVEQLTTLVVETLENMKARDIKQLDVTGISSFTDRMIVCSGTSSRQVKAISDAVMKDAKDQGVTAIGVEGQESAEWVLVDLGDVIVHVMQPSVRDFYQLEKLWDPAFAE